MELFDCPGAQQETIDSVTSLLTPLGSVRFEASLGTETVSSELPSATYRLRSGGWLACWDRETFRLELLVCRPQLPTSLTHSPEFPLTDCWAGMWRLRARAPIDPCLFAAVWEPDATWRYSNIETGEWLYAKTWDDEHSEVSIGTEDEDRLAGRVQAGDCLPKEWSDFYHPETSAHNWRICPYWQHESHERLRDIGLPTPTPSLQSGQRSRIHFVVAWADCHEGSVSTWLAVERTGADILAGDDCS